MPTSEDIFAAITAGDVARLQQLLRENGSLAMVRSPSGISALMTAAYHRNAEMVHLLRMQTTKLDIFEAASLGDVAQLRTLLQNGESVGLQSADGFTALHFAAFFDQPEAMRTLIASGANVNTKAENQSCVQPLHSAAACSSIEGVRILLENRAETNSRQHGGWTALHSAAKHGRLDIIDLLLQYGADPNLTSDDGQSAITIACNEQVRQRLS